MTAPTEGNGSGDAKDLFLEGVLQLFERFRAIHSTPDELIVKLSFAGSDDPYFFQGLLVDYAAGIPDCVLLRGWDSPPEAAVAIRVEHILKAEFLTRPPEPPLGFPGH